MADEMKKNAEMASAEAKKTASNEAKPKQKKPNAFVNFFKKIGKFFKECKIELRKIVWPTFSSTLKYTALVTVAIVLFTVVFFGLDVLFRDVLLRWLGKIPMLIANLGWG